MIRAGLLGQPVNSLSSLAFVVVGLGIMRSRPILGGAACAVGIGSFLFHGPMPDWAQWVHDVSLAVLIVALVWETRPLLVAVVATVLGAGFAAWPGMAVAATAALAAAAVVTLILLERSFPTLPITLFIAGAILTALSRTGGPLCSPDSLAQGHAAWHGLGAAAVWTWSRRPAALL